MLANRLESLIRLPEPRPELSIIAQARVCRGVEIRVMKFIVHFGEELFLSVRELSIGRIGISEGERAPELRQR